MTKENLQPPRNLKEKATQSSVGLRLQDVVLHTDTSYTALSELRQKTIAYQKVHPDSSERVALLESVCQTLFSTDLTETQATAQTSLRPYKANGEKRLTLVVSSASSSSASQETEVEILKTRGHTIDIPGAIEGRDTLSTASGDTALISTKAGLTMAQSRSDIKILNLADLIIGPNLNGSDIYYKSDILLLLILTNPHHRILTQLVSEIKTGSVIYPYNLDEETQIVLFWLAKRARVDKIDVNANSPEVGVELTRKGFKYPTIEAALKLQYSYDPYEMQKNEWQQSQCAKEIGYQPDTVPGYVVSHKENFAVFYQETLSAFMLMSTRYDFDSAWVKPDRGTDGGNQGSVKLNLVDNSLRQNITDLISTGQINQALDLYRNSLVAISEVDNLIKHMWENREDWVTEAKTNFFEIDFPYNGDSRKIVTTPSVHIIKGEPRYTISLQIVDGVAWGGNLICKAQTWNYLVGLINPKDPRIVANPKLISQLKDCFPLMTDTMQKYVSAINSSDRYKNGQVRGGADLAIATLGGKFGDELVIAVQDYNARANGCETAYALYDHAQHIYAGHGESVTRNFTPAADFNLLSSQLPQVVNELNSTYNRQLLPNQVKLLSVSTGWGQLGIIGDNALENLQNILLLEKQLKQMNLIN